MKALKDISSVYFIGIGGIGMSALARFFHERGAVVSGYDKTPTTLTRQLETEGIAVHYTDDLSLVPSNPDVVIYTPAIPSTHSELTYYRENGFDLLKRSEVLGIITRSMQNICVAGTHGKTTISTMVAHILRHSGKGCNAFLGGISANYKTNFWSSTNDVCVVEADEYDRSFLQLSPYVAIISSMDPDHLDIYGSAENMEQAFISFTEKIRPDGWLIKKFGLSRNHELKATYVRTYHLKNTDADVHADQLRVVNGSYVFDVVIRNNQGSSTRMRDMILSVGGLHNVENALAAIAAVTVLGIEEGELRSSLQAFKGVGRRFEYILAPGEGDIVLIDDYAHHPTELKALIQGVRSLFTQAKLLLAFQPHLFTRTRDFADGFAASLDMADQVILLPIYPARELPIEGVDSDLLIHKMKMKDKSVVSKADFVYTIKSAVASLKTNGDEVVVVTAGAGDIDQFISSLKDSFQHV